MKPLLKEIRHNPLLWLLAFVPVVFAAQKLKPEAHTLLFVLSVLAIVPLAVLLNHATEPVAAKTGATAPENQKFKALNPTRIQPRSTLKRVPGRFYSGAGRTEITVRITGAICMLRQILVGAAACICNIAIHACLMAAVIWASRIAGAITTSRQSLRSITVTIATVSFQLRHGRLKTLAAKSTSPW
jgi:hypothetical protein